uniref:Putative secreted protein ovary overexpressed n=1 Tax=Rhipicephalus microplus TaxID=6941 RepID=A0A6M2DAA5_RHIMP
MTSLVRVFVETFLLCLWWFEAPLGPALRCLLSLTYCMPSLMSVPRWKYLSAVVVASSIEHSLLLLHCQNISLQTVWGGCTQQCLQSKV